MLPEVIDLFSGCGGLALGFQKAGFEITHGVELIPEAIKTVSYNIDWKYGKKTSHICADITSLEPEIFKDKIGERGCIVIGGPPCQAYSLAGKGKLRSLGEDRINTNDARGYLYEDFLRFVLGLDARAVIMENVPESVKFGNINVPQHVCEILESNGYNAVWSVLNSADYGVPQTRERVFLVAFKKEENINYIFPGATHGTQECKKNFNEIRYKGFNKFPNFREAKKTNIQNPWVTVGEAIGDLPKLFLSAKSKYKLYPINMELEYFSDSQNEYQKLMREWYGSSDDSITGNCFRNNSRDFKIFERMNQGDNYLDACNIADQIFEETLKVEKITKEQNPDMYERIKKEIVPPYDRNKFFNKWRKLQIDKPSHTIVAHLSKDTYSHIHPLEPRGISVREAARLQSFPDEFYFNCSMGDAYKQIGNAVPPLLAKAIADSIRDVFQGGK